MSEVIRRRRLPHWDVDGAPYFLTTCLDGSIPARGLLDIAQYRREVEARPKPGDLSQQLWHVQQWKLVFMRREQWLDNESAIRHLADPRLAEAVVKALFHFAGQRYDLLAYVVMPSHIHWVFRPIESWVLTLDDAARRTARERIVHSVNRFTGQACNLLLGRTGSFWQHESYDHWVRDADELERIINYIENNPVKAALVQSATDWPYSSARIRREWKLELGEALVAPVSNQREG